MTLDYIDLVGATQLTDDLVRSALPDSPVRPDADTTRPALRSLRYGLSLALRRLADALEPALNRRTPAPEGC